MSQSQDLPDNRVFLSDRPFSDSHRVVDDYVKAVDVNTILNEIKATNKSHSPIKHFQFLDTQKVGIKACIQQAFREKVFNKFIMIVDVTSKLQKRKQLFTVMEKETVDGKFVMEAMVRVEKKNPEDELFAIRAPIEWEWKTDTLKNGTKYSVKDEMGEIINDAKGVVIAIDSSYSTKWLAEKIHSYIDVVIDDVISSRAFIIIKEALHPINEFIKE